MSDQLLEFVRRFLNQDIGVEEFVEKYPAMWKAERDNGALLEVPEMLNEALSSIFCLVDLYNPDADRESYEFDEHNLRVEIGQLSGLRAM